MGASVSPQPQWHVPAPTIKAAAPAGRRLWRRIFGILGLIVAVLWDLIWLAGWLFVTYTTRAESANTMGALALLQFAILFLGFILCLAGEEINLRWAKGCAAVVLTLVLAIGFIGAQIGDDDEYWQYWLFGVLLGLPDLLLVAGIAAMNWRAPGKVA
jgi:hypothetical protein